MSEDMLNVMGSFSETALDCIEKQNEEIQQLQQENRQLKQWDKNKDTRNSRQRVANYELLKENQELKEEIEKLNYIIDKQDRDITTISKGNKKLKSTLDEIREYIKCSKEHKLEHDGSNIYLTQYAVNDLLQILDKVK